MVGTDKSPRVAPLTVVVAADARTLWPWIQQLDSHLGDLLCWAKRPGEVKSGRTTCSCVYSHPNRHTASWIDMNLPAAAKSSELYAEGKGESCPVCGSEALDRAPPSSSENGAIIVWVGCESCRHVWLENYQLTGYSDLQLTNRPPNVSPLYYFADAGSVGE